MERLTKKCGEWGYTVIGLNSVVKDNADIIGKMIDKLAEYENLGIVEEFKELKEQRIIVTRGRESGKLITEKALKYDLLKKELEVYKKALHTALEECRYIEIEENVMPNFLEQARMELEDERKASEN